MFLPHLQRPIRSSGGFHPLAQLAAYGFLAEWWDADDHGTANMTDDGAGLISSWVGKVGATTVTATTTARPTWAATSFNGKAGLTFDGTANCLVSTSFAALTQGATPGMVWGLVSAASVTGAAQDILTYGGTAGGTKRRMYFDAAGAATASDQTSLVTDVFPLAGPPRVIGGGWDGTTVFGRVDGRAFMPPIAPLGALNTTAVRLRIGANNATAAGSFLGGVGRHFMVTQWLPLDLQQQLEAWLAWDCGVAHQLPSDHPFRDRRP